ncbi:MAG: fasciclin domain-containing protein [Pirellulales bacterium]
MKITTWIAAFGLAAILVGTHVVNCMSAESCRKVAGGSPWLHTVAEQKTVAERKMTAERKMPANKMTTKAAPAMMMKAPQRNIVQTAVGPGMQTVTTLVKAVQAAELVDALQEPGPFTVFAPTNDAFAKLPPGTIEELLKPENKDKLQAILLYHVHAGEALRSADLQPGKLSTLNGKAVEIKIDGPTIMVGGATVTKSDVIATNGVIHWLDTVILP